MAMITSGLLRAQSCAPFLQSLLRSSKVAKKYSIDIDVGTACRSTLSCLLPSSHLSFAVALLVQPWQSHGYDDKVAAEMLRTCAALAGTCI